MPNNKNNGEQPNAGKGMVSALLADENATHNDVRLVRRALRWGTLTPDKRAEVTRRLLKIVRKTSVNVVTKDGDVVAVDEPADRNAISAAGVLVRMVSQDQKDEHLERRIATQQQQRPATNINVGVRVDNNTDEHGRRLSAIAQRLGIDFIPESSGSGDTEAGAETSGRVKVSKR